MKKHIVFSLIALILFVSSMNAQSVSINSKSPSSNTLLDLSTNTNKTLVLPSISISSITDVSLINGGSPADGLMIYNPTSSGALLTGIYIWQTNTWNLLTTVNNNLTNLILKGSQLSLLTTALDNDYQTITPTGGYSIVQNDITNASTSGAIITLPKGKYTLEANIDFIVLNESSEIAQSIGTTKPYASMSQKTAHLHTYNAQLLNAGSSTIASVNAISNTSSSTLVKQHSVNFVFSFDLATSTGIGLQLCHAPGGTYRMTSATDNPGGVTTTNANVDIKEVIIHIQKRL